MNRCTKSISLMLMGSALGLVGCQAKAPDPNDCIEPDPGGGEWGGSSSEEKSPGQACYNSRYNGTHSRATAAYRGRTIVPIPVPIPVGGGGPRPVTPPPIPPRPPAAKPPA